MPNLNVSPSSQLTVVSTIAPQSLAAGDSATSGWVSGASGSWIGALVALGALGGGTVTISWLQAKDASGTASKALTAGDYASSTNATNNAHVMTEARPELLDTANGFKYIALELANAGGTGGLVSGFVYAAGVRNETGANPSTIPA